MQRQHRCQTETFGPAKRDTAWRIFRTPTEASKDLVLIFNETTENVMILCCKYSYVCTNLQKYPFCETIVSLSCDCPFQYLKSKWQNFNIIIAGSGCALRPIATMLWKRYAPYCQKLRWRHAPYYHNVPVALLALSPEFSGERCALLTCLRTSRTGRHQLTEFQYTVKSVNKLSFVLI